MIGMVFEEAVRAIQLLHEQYACERMR